MNITDLKTKYKDHWILAKVTKENKAGQVLEAEPLVTSKDRQDIDKQIKGYTDQHITVIFTGKIPPRI